MSYCPFLREKCRGVECAFWLDKVPDEGNKCAIYWIGLSFRTGLEESVSSSLKQKARNEKVLQALKGKSAEEFAKEIIEFMRKNYPEMLKAGYILPEVFDYFWAERGITKTIFFENPELDVIREKIEAIVKLSLEKGLEKPEEIVSEIDSIPYTKKYPPEDTFKELKEKSAEELADELLQFIQKEFPEAIERRVGLYEAKKLYWLKKGLRYGIESIDDPDISLKIRRAELLAEEKIRLKMSGQEGVTNKSEEELANELVEFIRKEFQGELTPSIKYQARYLFWKQKGVERYQVDPALELKITKVENIAFNKLEREILSKLVDECILWAKEHNLKKVTKSNINCFLAEKGIKLSTMNKDALYSQVNVKLQDEKY
jgi:hypothetical protein